MSQHKETTPQAVEACHDLLAWMIPQLDKLPRSRRFTIGERIESGLLEVLERLIEAAYSRGTVKFEALNSANLRLDTVRHLWRLGHGLGNVPHKQYQHGARLMEDLGRQLGAWRQPTCVTWMTWCSWPTTKVGFGSFGMRSRHLWSLSACCCTLIRCT